MPAAKRAVRRRGVAPVERRDGSIQLSRRPGFGVELDEAAVERFAVAPATRVPA